ncbi:MAG: AbrB/MazE/SpoVT family DNA-binding domain-containing protein [Clostridiales bacterium]|jgi:AbrB family looped-hinge helix DNA binding protein|nr:AbrB/MazE/SpoVT family DNA-binding domain-containing protein [Clostridiales bacterium]
MNQTAYFTDSAKVMAKGQITLPKDIRRRLGIGTGDKITFVCEGNKVLVMNAAVFAMEAFAREMSGEAEKAGFASEQDAMDYVAQMRREEIK